MQFSADNLQNSLTRKMFGERVKEMIDAHCVEKYSDERRTHLGASAIGDDCERKLWYSFRWVRKEQFESRMLRLFNRGHITEPRCIEWLQGIGFEVWTVDQNTNKQFRISGCKGHFGGSLDGVNKPPIDLTDVPMLCEFKTSKTGKPFNDLVTKGVELAKPQHFAQMCSYGFAYGFEYALYMCINKNDDDLYIECVKLDWKLAQHNLNKAESIICATLPPPRIAEQPSYWKCQYCTFKGPCHYDEPVDKNCRSCRNAFPIDNAQWFCKHFDKIIPNEFIVEGCDAHIPITEKLI